MKNLIKELKRDIIRGASYADEERETHNGEEYSIENLILESSSVIYSRRVFSDERSEECAARLCSAEEFLKIPITEIENLINAAIYYNTQEVIE